MPSLYLTDLTIRSLKAETRTDFWDTKTPSFGVRVGAHSKTFIAKVNNRRHTLGQYPELSLADARRKALAVKSEAPADKAPSLSFDEARDKFFEIHTPTLKPRTKKEVERILRRHFYWKKALDKITHNDVATAVEAVKARSEAWHAFKDIRTFFRWCVPRYLAHSPMEGLKSPSKYIARKRVLTVPELVSVWRAAGRAGYPFGTILQLLIITGQRYGEIASLRWEYINPRDQIITLPETKNGRQHTFPYNGMVADILETVPRLNTTSLLFPGRDPQKAWNGAGKAKYLLEWRPPIKPWTIHDLRRTTSTIWAGPHIKAPPHIVERLLGHRLGTLQTEGVISAVAEVYNTYMYLDEMRETVLSYDRYLESLLSR